MYPIILKTFEIEAIVSDLAKMGKDREAMCSLIRCTTKMSPEILGAHIWKDFKQGYIFINIYMKHSCREMNDECFKSNELSQKSNQSILWASNLCDFIKLSKMTSGSLNNLETDIREIEIYWILSKINSISKKKSVRRRMKDDIIYHLILKRICFIL